MKEGTSVCLVTGANGFIGKYLIEQLLVDKQFDVILATDIGTKIQRLY